MPWDARGCTSDDCKSSATKECRKLSFWKSGQDLLAREATDELVSATWTALARARPYPWSVCFVQGPLLLRRIRAAVLGLDRVKSRAGGDEERLVILATEADVGGPILRHRNLLD